MASSGQVYIPKELREPFGRELTILPNASAAVIFRTGTNYEDILRSLEIIAQDIRHRIELQRKQGRGQLGDDRHR
jgi:bifunctional DNA-binding transcriptional regulator/antitoxin component of YhaV-PrlF toxin-antitoxin module